MPLSFDDTFDVPYASSPIEVALEPARGAIQSLLMLTRERHPAGIVDWVVETEQAMSPAERKTNNLVLVGLHYVAQPRETWNAFPAYLDHLAALPPEALRDKMLEVYEHVSFNPHPEGPLLDLPSALASPENYIAYLRQHFLPDSIDEEIEREAYRYVMDPPALQKLVVEHLRHMWKRYLSEEWDRVRPTLQAIVRAYRKVDLKGKSVIEAGRLITGQELNEEKWISYFAEARRVVFIPHPHVGPYISKCQDQNHEIYVFFSARLPDRLAEDVPELSRPEIAIRLSALADDTRLRILRHLADNGEQRSQGIMEALDLSQSAASRHLTQLSAAGFINERRCEGAKCYALNPERVSDTLQAIASFLSIPERNRP